MHPISHTIYEKIAFPDFIHKLYDILYIQHNYRAYTVEVAYTTRTMQILPISTYNNAKILNKGITNRVTNVIQWLSDSIVIV